MSRRYDIQLQNRYDNACRGVGCFRGLATPCLLHKCVPPFVSDSWVSYYSVVFTEFLCLECINTTFLAVMSFIQNGRMSISTRATVNTLSCFPVCVDGWLSPQNWPPLYCCNSTNTAREMSHSDRCLNGKWRPLWTARRPTDQPGRCWPLAASAS